MYAIVEIQGQQFKAEQGKKLFVHHIKDAEAGKTVEFDKVLLVDADGSKSKLNMPTTSNVLQWFCEDGTKVSVRPSGTEPKIKFYTEVKDPSFKDAADYERCLKNAETKIEALKKSLNL